MLSFTPYEDEGIFYLLSFDKMFAFSIEYVKIIKMYFEKGMGEGMKKKMWVKKGVGVTVIAAMGIGLLFGKIDMEQAFAATGPVEINETNFPDEKFREYVKTNFDTDGNNELSTAELNAVISINVYRMGITDLKGIEYFEYLQDLNCSYNELSSLDTSQNGDLSTLTCSNNNISNLDLSKNSAISTLSCSNNQLNSLDISGIDSNSLKNIYASGNHLTELDVSKHDRLKNLVCSSNSLSSLDISHNTELSYLACGNNNLTSLDISKNTNLTVVFCENNKIKNIDTSVRPNLLNLDISNNELTDLDVSQNTNLQQLNCSGNHLSSLDLSTNTQLYNLSNSGNQTSATFYKNETESYVDLSAYSLNGGKVSNVETGSYNTTDGRIDVPDTLKVGDSLTYDYATGYGSNTMTVTVVITSVVDTTLPDTEEPTTEQPTTEGSATETPATEGTAAASTADAATEITTSTTDSASGAGTTAASEQKNTPKTGDTALPVWIGILGILGMVNYLVARKKKG